MNRKSKKSLVLIIVLLILSFTGICINYFHNVNINNRLKQYDIEVFVPNGIADKYKNLNPFSLDSWEIYEYNLNSQEIESIEKTLSDEYWSKLEGEDKDYFVRDYFYPKSLNQVWQEDFSLSDEVYVSTYTETQKPYHYSETSIFDNWYIFVYDKGSSSYYCIYVNW